MNDRPDDERRQRPPISPEVSRLMRELFASFVSQEMLEALPEPTSIYTTDGVMLAANDQMLEFWRVPREVAPFGRIRFDGIELPQSQLDGFAAATEGRRTNCPLVRVELPKGERRLVTREITDVWVETVFTPLLGPERDVRYVVMAFRDATDNVSKQRRIQAQGELIEELRAAQARIETQQEIIRELSFPIMEIWPGVLTVPVVGNIDGRRARELTERLLASVTAHDARHVILDLTGVERLSAATGEHLLKILRAVPLLGGEVMLTGIHPGVARAIVALGLELPSIRTHRNIRGALEGIIRGAAPRR